MEISIIFRRYQSGHYSSILTSSICAMSCLDTCCGIFCMCYCFSHFSFIIMLGFAGIMLFGIGIDLQIYGTQEKHNYPPGNTTWLIGGALLLLAVLLFTLSIYCCRYGCCWNNNQENWPKVIYIKHYHLQHRFLKFIY